MNQHGSAFTNSRRSLDSARPVERALALGSPTTRRRSAILRDKETNAAVKVRSFAMPLLSSSPFCCWQSDELRDNPSVIFLGTDKTGCVFVCRGPVSLRLGRGRRSPSAGHAEASSGRRGPRSREGARGPYRER